MNKHEIRNVFDWQCNLQTHWMESALKQTQAEDEAIAESRIQSPLDDASRFANPPQVMPNWRGQKICIQGAHVDTNVASQRYRTLLHQHLPQAQMKYQSLRVIVQNWWHAEEQPSLSPSFVSCWSIANAFFRAFLATDSYMSHWQPLSLPCWQVANSLLCLCQPAMLISARLAFWTLDREDTADSERKILERQQRSLHVAKTIQILWVSTLRKRAGGKWLVSWPKSSLPELHDNAWDADPQGSNVAKRG